MQISIKKPVSSNLIDWKLEMDMALIYLAKARVNSCLKFLAALLEKHHTSYLFLKPQKLHAKLYILNLSYDIASLLYLLQEC